MMKTKILRNTLSGTLFSLGLIFAVAAVLPVRPTAKTPAVFRPAVAEWQFLGSGTTPPTEADCFAVGRRCFTPSAMESAYNLLPLYAAGNEGQGITIAVI